MKKKLAIVLIIILILVVGLLFYKKPANNTKELNMGYVLDENSEEDTDGDGISNKKEKEYQTNPVLIDTDLDGLDDLFEIEQTKTSPLKKDTDGDGLTDYNEFVLNLNPIKKDSKEDGINDSERNNIFEIKSDDVTLEITGTGNIADTHVNVIYNTKAALQEGALNKEFSFYSSGNINTMKATFSLTKEELDFLSISPYEWNEVVIAQINKDNYQDYKLLFDADYDFENNTISIPIENYDKYIYTIGDAKRLDYTTTTTPKKEKSGWRLIADSGFDVKKNGFSFPNYTTNYAKTGNCYGMAMFAGLYYKKALPLKANGKNYQPSFLGLVNIPEYKKSYSYDLTNTYFASYLDLHNFKIKTDVSKQFDLKELQKNTTIPVDEIQMFNAIYQMFTMQKVIKLQYTGGYNNSNIIESFFSRTDCMNYKYLYCQDNAEGTINTLQKRIANKETPVFVIDGLRHGVNAIRLYQYKYSNKYKVIIYDNNYVDEERELNIECSNSSCVINYESGAKGNFAFPKSLEEELKFF